MIIIIPRWPSDFTPCFKKGPFSQRDLGQALLGEVLEDNTGPRLQGEIQMRINDSSAFHKENIFGLGQANTAYAQFFTGYSYLNPLAEKGQCPVSLANVTFEPGCRNHWHIHRASEGGGQILICTAGEGWYQEEGKKPVSLVPGMVITIPANVKHWHGAKKDSWFSHIAVEVPGVETSNQWLEPVDDETYDGLE